MPQYNTDHENVFSAEHNALITVNAEKYYRAMIAGGPHRMENHVGHRAVGVVYQPQYERHGNYVPTILPLRYDAFIYLDETHALHPLHIEPDGHLVPETYPFGV